MNPNPTPNTDPTPDLTEQGLSLRLSTLCGLQIRVEEMRKDAIRISDRATQIAADASRRVHRTDRMLKTIDGSISEILRLLRDHWNTIDPESSSSSVPNDEKLIAAARMVSTPTDDLTSPFHLGF